VAVAAELALVPAGWANRWGFPKPDVAERYRAQGAQVETSGISGALQLRVSPEQGVQRLTRWREQSRRLWRAS
jgi:competence protein ComEC